MMHERLGPWVVYFQPVKGSADGLRAVCTQREWVELTRHKSGELTLVRGGMTNEGEAERLARGSSGDRPVRGSRPSGVRRVTWARRPAAPPESVAGAIS